MNNLANVYHKQQKYTEAEQLYVECLEKQKSILGIDHPDTLKTMNNLAIVYKNQHKYKNNKKEKS